MNKVPAVVEIHYALWGVLAVPVGFAGVFFVFPGLLFKQGLPLLVVAGFLLLYISKLTQFSRAAWMVGVIVHAAFSLGALYYIPRWPDLLAVPLAIASLYSLVVLLAYRNLWLGVTKPEAQPI